MIWVGEWFRPARGQIATLSRRIDLMFISQYHQNAGWSSLVARWAHNPKVGGSNPPPATNGIIELRTNVEVMQLSKTVL